MIDKRLLEILACPLTKAPVVLDGDRLVSTDAATRKAYRIEDGIPVMLIDEATELSASEHAEVLSRHGAKPFLSSPKAKAS